MWRRSDRTGLALINLRAKFAADYFAANRLVRIAPLIEKLESSWVGIALGSDPKADTEQSARQGFFAATASPLGYQAHQAGGRAYVKEVQNRLGMTEINLRIKEIGKEEGAYALCEECKLYKGDFTTENEVLSSENTLSWRLIS